MEFYAVIFAAIVIGASLFDKSLLYVILFVGFIILLYLYFYHNKDLSDGKNQQKTTGAQYKELENIFSAILNKNVSSID